MSDVDGSIKFKATLDTTDTTKGLNDIKKKTDDTTSSMQNSFAKSFNNIKNSGSSFGQALTLLLNPIGLLTAASLALGNTMTTSFKNYAWAESTVKSLEQLTGSTEAANKAFQEINDSAAQTPYTIAQLSDSSKVLAKLGVDAQNLASTTMALGDVAGGDAARLNQLSDAFGLVNKQGVLTERTLKSLIVAGFDPLAEISASTGESIDSLTEKLRDGEITAQDLSDSLSRATSETGKFGSASETLSLTWDSLNKSLKDNIDNLGANIFAPVFEVVKVFKSAFVDLTGELVKFTSKYAELGNELKGSEKLWSGVYKAIESLKIYYSTLFEGLSTTISLVVNSLSAIANAFFGPDFQSTALSLTNTLTAMSFAFSVFSRAVNLSISALMLLVDTLIAVTLYTGVAIESILVLAEVLGKALVLDFSGAKEAFKSGINMMSKEIVNANKIMATGVQGVAESASKLTKDSLDKLWQDTYAKIENAGKEGARKAEIAGREVEKGYAQGIESDLDSVTLSAPEIEQPTIPCPSTPQNCNSSLDFAQQITSSISSDLGSISDITNDFYGYEMDKVEQYNKDYLDALDDRQEAEREAMQEQQDELESNYNKGLKSGYEYQLEKKALDEEQAKIEEQLALEKEQAEKEANDRKNAIAEQQFNANKANQLAMLAVDTASSIMGTWVSYSKLGIPGQILAGIQIGMISALSATQAAIISMQKFVPAFEKGGIMQNSGLALVGEAGPELVHLSAGDRVYNANDTKNMIGKASLLSNSQKISGDNMNNINITINANNVNEEVLVGKLKRVLGRQLAVKMA